MKVTRTTTTTYEVSPEESVAIYKAHLNTMIDASLDPKKHAAVIEINQIYAKGIGESVGEAWKIAANNFFTSAPQTAANMWLAGMKAWGFTK
jgi:hypothetical protein